MDTDEYEYLEKAVEEKVNVSEKPEEDRRRSHHSGKGEEKGSGRRSMDEEANVSDRREHRDRRERDRDPNEYRDRDRRGSSRSRRHDREAEEDRDMDRERRSSSRSRRHDREVEEDRDRDRGRRSSSRSRRHDREAEVDRDRDRDRDRGRRSSSRSRRHDIEAEEERERQSMSRSRRYEREDLNGERDWERERSRRSESRSRRYDREVEHEMERARSRDRIERERELEREFREKESRRSKEKKEVEELEADPERDQRTVFAYQMPLKATERDVYEFFSQAGKVRDVRLIMDRISKRSKGVGYIEFYDVMSIQKAIQLTGQLLLGQPVMVKHSEAEKNLVSSTTTGSGASGVGAERKLYVGNLHFLMNEEQLRKIFEAFGPVELVQLPLDMETGYCKGFGFVQFAQIEHAKAAQQSLNGTLEIAGRIIKVSSVIEHVGTQDAGSNATDFDDDDGGGLALNAHSRALLMQKLDRTGTATSIVNGGIAAVPSMTAPKTAITTTLPTVVRSSTIEPIGQPSECVLLKNMFDPKTETDPDFDLEIKEDVQDECSKFGTVRHIYVDKNSSGHVYLRFDSIAAAGNCQRAMHMRWFARRCISATFMMPHDYEAKFKGIS